jgi:hypothetical protein
MPTVPLDEALPAKEGKTRRDKRGSSLQLLSHFCGLLVFIPSHPYHTQYFINNSRLSLNIERTAGIAQPSSVSMKDQHHLKILSTRTPNRSHSTPPRGPMFHAGQRYHRNPPCPPTSRQQYLLRRHSAVLPATHPHRGRDKRAYYRLYCPSSALVKRKRECEVAGVLTIVISPSFVCLAEVGSQRHVWLAPSGILSTND